ncbi:hypothetical protein OIV19_19255 [Brucella sp. HL-2]|nr:transposase [Brucella sp. HL-2]MCV9909741.1 hypothetical protein [Brucella sp. HL-2]
MINLPEQAPQALLADKGYDADVIRNDLASRNIEPVIAGRANRRVKIEYDRTLYKQRNLIERMFGRLKINRAIAPDTTNSQRVHQHGPYCNHKILAQICPRCLAYGQNMIGAI